MNRIRDQITRRCFVIVEVILMDTVNAELIAEDAQLLTAEIRLGQIECGTVIGYGFRNNRSSVLTADSSRCFSGLCAAVAAAGCRRTHDGAEQ